jgi:MFS family permease
MQFMLIIWLQGIWLPLHGYDYESTPLWAGIYLLPLTVGFLVAGPISGKLSDRYGARLFATGGMVLVALSFVGFLVLPVDFAYWQFAGLLLVNGLASGLFAAPNSSMIMNSVPADQRGSASGMRGTFMNSGMALSIGIFFSLMVAGLAANLPQSLRSGLTGQGVPGDVAGQVADLPPVGSLFASFLGFNPIQTLLEPFGVLQQVTQHQAATLTGKTFFPQLISGPFQDGLFVVFLGAAVMSLVAAWASFAAGGKYVHDDTADAVSTPSRPEPRPSLVED